MAREVRLWEWMRDGLKAVEGLHMRRVENKVSEGDPDVDGCFRGKYFEVELKGCDRPVREGALKFDIRNSQAIWHRKRTKCGGNNWLYVRVGIGNNIRRYLIRGGWVPQLKDLQDGEGILESDLISLAELPPDHTVSELLQVLAPL